MSEKITTPKKGYILALNVYAGKDDDYQFGLYTDMNLLARDYKRMLESELNLDFDPELYEVPLNSFDEDGEWDLRGWKIIRDVEKFLEKVGDLDLKGNAL